MKKVFLAILCISLYFTNAEAQYRFPAIDLSVMDAAYYPLGGMSQARPLKVKVIYSRPLKNGRDVFGGLQKFGEVWRAGANESTEIRFYVPVKLGDKEIPAGIYSLYTLLEKDHWTIIINSVTDRWGINRDNTSTRDPSKDIAQLSVPVKPLDNVQESFAMTFTERPDGANLVMGWDKTAVEVPLIFAK